MKKEVRTICYDEELQIEAYCLEGIVQPFPNHFHDFYVVGFIEEGKRRLTCKGKQFVLEKGDIVLFNPGDTHACERIDDSTLDYRAFNISVPVMKDKTAEAAGAECLLAFSETVIRDAELAAYLHPLHKLVMSGEDVPEKEEYFWLMLSRLIERCGYAAATGTEGLSPEVETVCAYMERHFAESLSLTRLCQCGALSKSTLLRAFTKSKGVTPYRYLQAVRVNRAKKLLEQGGTPVEVALQTGFSDQSHFTNAFSMFIGLSPGAYRGIFRERGKEEANGDET